MLYFLVTAMFPRFLITLDEKLDPLPVTVRVGQVRVSIFHLPSVYLTRLVGCRRRRPSRQAADDLWIPDAPDASAVGDDGARGTGDGGVLPIRACVGRVRHLAKEPRVGGGQDGNVDHDSVLMRTIRRACFLLSALSLRGDEGCAPWFVCDVR